LSLILKDISDQIRHPSRALALGGLPRFFALRGCAYEAGLPRFCALSEDCGSEAGLPRFFGLRGDYSGEVGRDELKALWLQHLRTLAPEKQSRLKELGIS